MYSVSQIADVMDAERSLVEPGTYIEHLLTDSRRLVVSAATLFFAIQTSRRDGSEYVPELYTSGVRNFVVKQGFDHSSFPGGNFIFANDVLGSLQTLVVFHRKQFAIPVIGITGSNGKTVVKEWLYQLLMTDERIVRSPKSYNSQVGVPLSVWQINDQHSLGIFEAGISQTGEMAALANIIQPTIGVLTNIGEAHNSGFNTKEEKLHQKFKLFDSASVVVCNTDNPIIRSFVENIPAEKLFLWGDNGRDLSITSIERHPHSTSINALHKGRQSSITIPFSDNASIENAIACWCVLLLLGKDAAVISNRMQMLQPVEMRLQLKKAINQCSIINDSYSNDLSSLNIALDFLQQQAGKQGATVILSDLGEASNAPQQYARVAAALLRYQIGKFIGIGPDLFTYQSFFNQLPVKYFFRSVEEFSQQMPLITFRDEVILLKGARVFEFEKIGNLFEQKVHQTVMEVNLSAMIHNLKTFHDFLQPTTKVMVMVKAFSYGSGSAEVASVLQYHKVDYLAVAYADEGVELRKAGIHMPIMVMNPEDVTFPLLLQYNLEPELYSLNLLRQFTNFITAEGVEQVGVHLKLDTGMHRLGFNPNEIDQVVEHLVQHKSLIIKSVFTHLVGSDAEEHDAFTMQQMQLFDDTSSIIQQKIGYSFLKHISNTAAIFRHPALQYNMVRLGIGLYGIDTSDHKQLQLQPVATLRTTIAQIRNVKAGDSVGYSRRGLLERDSMIATIRIGYADGFSRRLGNGKGYVLVNSQKAFVVGNVCMDMTMVDITGLEGVNEGDTVEVFGPNLSLEHLAKWSDTIPYEIMTGISLRVKRIYFEE